MRKLLLVASALAALGIVVLAGCAWPRLEESRRLAKASQPFNASPPNAAASLLVVGDSTAAGTGASSASTSLAGQLFTRYPRTSITNLADDGARFEDVVTQLERAPARRYDAVLIQAGGNDVIRFTGRGRLREDVGRALARASKLAPLVVVMPAGNVGNAPFFKPPLSWIMTARAQAMHDIVEEEARASGAVYVRLYKPRESDPFAQQPERYHASDGLHPSDAGYAQWLDELLRNAPIGRALAGGNAASPPT